MATFRINSQVVISHHVKLAFSDITLNIAYDSDAESDAVRKETEGVAQEFLKVCQRFQHSAANVTLNPTMLHPHFDKSRKGRPVDLKMAI